MFHPLSAFLRGAHFLREFEMPYPQILLKRLIPKYSRLRPPFSFQLLSSSTIVDGGSNHSSFRWLHFSLHVSELRISNLHVINDRNFHSSYPNQPSSIFASPYSEPQRVTSNIRFPLPISNSSSPPWMGVLMRFKI